MVSLSQRFLISVVLLHSAGLPWAVAADNSAISPTPARFRADDPVLREPVPAAVSGVQHRSIDPLYDFLQNSFLAGRVIDPSIRDGRRTVSVNTLGGVPDSTWFTNRHASRRMSADELQRGPGNDDAPERKGVWRVTAAKSDGVTPGFTIEDSRCHRYLLKLDPPDYQELASGADMIGSKMLYALGYNTPENYIVHFRRDQLMVDPAATYRDAAGHVRPLNARHIDELLRKQPRDGSGEVRALASRMISGTIIGPFRYTGTRKDDPNDVIPHEDRRELRGLRILAAWLNHTDSKSINTLDSLVEEDGCKYVRHYLIDFGAALGSDSTGPKDPRLGHDYFVDIKPTVQQVASLGLTVPAWARTRYPRFRSVGRFTAVDFDPARWKPNYPNPAFARMQPADAFWAARQVAAFSNDDVRALVATAEYSDPRAAEYVAQVLIQRRDAILRTYTDAMLPVDQFAIAGDRLTFVDFATKHGIRSARDYSVSWFVYEDGVGRATPVHSSNGHEVPRLEPEYRHQQYLAATLRYAQSSAAEQKMSTTVYFRRTANGWVPVGVDRTSADGGANIVPLVSPREAEVRSALSERVQRP